MQAWTKDIDKVHHLQTLKTPTIAILQPVTERNECNALKKVYKLTARHEENCACPCYLSSRIFYTWKYIKAGPVQ